jgi:hypothetical protein
MLTANAVNIADGLDGLAGGSLVATFSALTLLSTVANIPPLAFLNATAAGALITYTYFNIKPARFQMGDVGSLGLNAQLADDEAKKIAQTIADLEGAARVDSLHITKAHSFTTWPV